MEKILKQFFDQFNSRFDSLQTQLTELNNGQKLVEKRLDRLEKGQQQMEERLDRLEKGQQQMEKRLHSVEKRLMSVENTQQQMEQRLTELEKGQERIELKVDQLGTEMRSQFKHLDQRLDRHEKVFEVVSAEMKNIRIDVQYLSEKAGKHDLEINNIMKRLGV